MVGGPRDTRARKTVMNRVSTSELGAAITRRFLDIKRTKAQRNYAKAHVKAIEEFISFKGGSRAKGKDSKPGM